MIVAAVIRGTTAASTEPNTCITRELCDRPAAIHDRLIYYCLLLLVKTLGRSLQAAMVVQSQKVQS
jgi:hypothetical protein